MNNEVEKRVEQILGDFSGSARARELFSELSYDIARDPLSRDGWGRIAGQALAEDPQVIATHGDFLIIYNRLDSDKLLITPQRAVVNTLLQQYPYALFLFSTADEQKWHFVNVKLAGPDDEDRNRQPEKRRLFRRICIEAGQKRLRTAIERLSMLDLEEIEPGATDIPPLTIQSSHDEAFDVEQVTRRFYEEYEELFKKHLWGPLAKQTGDTHWAHDYSLQLLNRTMFLYFVQRKGWLAGDGEFLETFWKTYQKSSRPKDTFFRQWLSVLFFEAFNNHKNLLNSPQRAYLPEGIRSALWQAPFLNGGLFKENKLDRPFEQRQDLNITDRQFGRVFDLFQSYNFTITEDSPLDKEVAVDPEMIGKVYESLVNVTEEEMERGKAGIFYTPRTEIDLMCRLSLVDNLANHLGSEHKNLFYELAFSLEQEDKDTADSRLAGAGLWPAVAKHLSDITVLDPACGSGSFLVGMLYILNDLLERAEKQKGPKTGSYDRKKKIIGRSLYGVDVMDWACHVAELRLWLALIVDAEFPAEKLAVREEPLLPHFTFKVRCGDSLVQEVGGINMAHRRGAIELTDRIKRKLRDLRREKAKFYANDPDCKFKTAEQLEQQEVSVFRELLQDRIKKVHGKAEELMRIQAEKRAQRQYSLTGELEGTSEQFTLDRERRERQITALMETKQGLERLCDVVRDSASVPFVWDIAFSEIFQGDSHGFDVVIGNPPYVNKERIAAPILPDGSVVTTDKKDYKAKLAQSVYLKYPQFFRYNSKTGRASHKIDAKSDLYIYFYFDGLSLLNDKGSFCFITSNSWLDVGYGRDLQEFLLKRCHTKIVIDNKAKRSFKEADVNTVIVLFGPPEAGKTADEVSLEKTARFVMFYVPFEEVLHPVVFEEVDEAGEKTTREEYRVFPIRQADLLSDGCEPLRDVESENTKAKSPGLLVKSAKYIGNKWGGKYLRAPDIYWTIMRKAAPILGKLQQVSGVNEGRPTGANEFFYPSYDLCQRFQIEQEFLYPGLMKTRGANYYKIRPDIIDRCFFAVDKPKSALKGTGALSYILYGEEQGLHKRKTFLNKHPWYAFRVREPADLLLPCGFGSTFFCAFNEAKAVSSNSFTELRVWGTHKDVAAIWIWMNCAISWLYVELIGRASLGGGMLKADPIDYRQMPIIKSEYFTECSVEIDRKVGSISEEVSKDDRRALDRLAFDILSLTKTERDAVYEAVIDLVESRLKKAGSLRQ